jgi:hypothetical protein
MASRLHAKWLRNWGLTPSVHKRFLCSPTVLVPELGPNQPTNQCVLGFFAKGWSSQNAKKTTHFHVMPRLKKTWIYILHFPYFIAWCLIKHRDNFTFTNNTDHLRHIHDIPNYTKAIYIHSLHVTRILPIIKHVQEFYRYMNCFSFLSFERRWQIYVLAIWPILGSCRMENSCLLLQEYGSEYICDILFILLSYFVRR